MGPFKDVQGQEKFMQLYLEALDSAKDIVTDREGSRNAAVSLPSMFLSGPSTIVDLIFMKAARTSGEVLHSKWKTVASEVEDILNYAGFLLAYLKFYNLQSNGDEGGTGELIPPSSQPVNPK